MNTAQWKDQTKLYDDTEIKGSEIRFGVYRLTVHRHIHYASDTWLASCDPDVFSAFELASKKLNEAKCQAKAKLQTILETALTELLES